MEGSNGYVLSKECATTAAAADRRHSGWRQAANSAHVKGRLDSFANASQQFWDGAGGPGLTNARPGSLAPVVGPWTI